MDSPPSSSEAKVLSISDPDSAHDAGVTSVAISTSGHLVAAGSLDAVVRIWDAQTGALLERLRGHRDSVYSVAFTPDGKGLVSGSLDKTLKYWDVSGLVNQVKAKKDVGGAMVGLAGGKKEGESQCTMNFTGHKVRFPSRFHILTKTDTIAYVGLRPLSGGVARRPVGGVRLQRPRRAVLGLAHRNCSVYAAGAQELGYIYRPEPSRECACYRER